MTTDHVSKSGMGELASHVGHRVNLVGYGLHGEPPWHDIALECEECDTVIADWQPDEPKPRKKKGKRRMAEPNKRPWTVAPHNWDVCMKDLFPRWLTSRGGIVVYENHVLDSSCLGDKTFMPARFLAQEDDQLHDAPDQYRPNGGLPSQRQQKVDTITLEEFEGSTDKALSCFVKEPE